MLKVEIASTPSSQEKGLMFRSKLPFDRGMLFIFSHSQKLNFWGKNTLIPLDIAFVDDKNIISKISHIPVLSEKPVSSGEECLMAIETNIGYFHQNDIEPGQKISINNVNGKVAIVVFI